MINVLQDAHPYFANVKCVNKSASKNTRLPYNRKYDLISIEINLRKRLFSLERPSLYFNNAIVEQGPVKKRLGIELDSKLLFSDNISCKINKAMKYIRLLL